MLPEAINFPYLYTKGHKRLCYDKRNDSVNSKQVNWILKELLLFGGKKVSIKPYLKSESCD